MEIIYFTKKALSGEIIIFVLSSSFCFPLLINAVFIMKSRPKVNPKVFDIAMFLSGRFKSKNHLIS